MTLTPTLSIVVPCYNESKNLDRLVSAFRCAIGSRQDIELVLVDNGSKDDTADVMGKLLTHPENTFARSVTVDVNQGYGYGILFGLRKSHGEYLAWTHADLQTPPEDVIRALNCLIQMPDPSNSLVRGNRKGRPIFDQFFTSAMGWVASAALGGSYFDVNAQPKVFHHSLMQHMDEAPYDFTLDLYILYVASELKMDIELVDVRFDLRTEGESKGGGTLLGKYRLCKRTFGQIWKLRKSLQQSQRVASTKAVKANEAPAKTRSAA
ncbi:glycosyl transferase family 2 [Blastopirellula marina]|uniref:Glycosyl transferase family 2 n=1 Tax=Blastopirellula marina TaxID=124 RepID=A0A2S8G3E1_9BACT|nr:glycosyl transferase family 2 [Blastopirellula marina]RCS55118.1 glycosyltransferase family 2 protein [Bremerella cremea]